MLHGAVNFELGVTMTSEYYVTEIPLMQTVSLRPSAAL